jgi:NADPH:quinone reductase-like Zn-dependent oxidoreductase
MQVAVRIGGHMRAHRADAAQVDYRGERNDIGMKAIICTAYGPPDVLALQEIAKPHPKENQLLVRIHATTVSRADCELRRFDFPGWVWLPVRLWFGLRKPRVRILGQEFAGEVEAAGGGATSFSPGDRVFGTTGMGLGAYAEYICLGGGSEGSALAGIPANMSYAEAAAVPYGGSEALRFLRKGNIQAGQQVLIIGAGGSFGTFAVQLAKHFGAEVCAVDSTSKLEMLRSLGADTVIDYTEQDFTDSAQTFDLIFDVVCKAPLARVLRVLRPGGRCLLANPHTSHLLRGLWATMTGDKKVIFGSGSGTAEDLSFLRELIEAGKLRPIIDRRFPLEQMAEAHRYAETEQKQGNIVIIVGEEVG